jgi:nitroimidazol reductase NimA-like FMN-containing flavoprotein (pyridoxamine 5'-phosphate oxidase superfamily)
MTTRPNPTFVELTRDEAEAILGRNRVGRLAFAFHDRVDIQPLSYAFENPWIYLRTQEGAKISTLTHNRWAAFEVDEIDGPFDWRSVVVRGGVYLMDPAHGTTDEATYHHAVALLRRLTPGALTVTDPVPFRDVILRLHVDELTGRQATSPKNK